MKKILPKDRVRSEKGAGKQAKRWKNAGHERTPDERTPQARSGPKPATPRARAGVRKTRSTPP